MSANFVASASDPSQGRLPAVLLALRAMAEREQATPAFLKEWLDALVSSTGAVAGRCWLCDARNRWSGAASAGQADGLPELPAERLEELRTKRFPIVAAGPAAGEDAGPVTEIWNPIFAAGELRGAVVAVFAVQSPAAQQGCLRFVMEAGEAIERHFLLADRRKARRRAELAEQERKLVEAAQRSLNVKAVAAALAGDGRVLIGCDRLAVLGRRGKRFRVAAVSGQADVARRAGAVRALQDLARRCAPLEESVEFPAETRQGDPNFLTTLERYVDDHHVKRFVFVPLFAQAPPPPDETAATPKKDWLGALIVEYFGETTAPVEESEKIAAVARSAEVALRNARQYQSIFLLPLWSGLGKLWNACFGPGKALRTGLIAGAVALLIAAALFTETEFTAYCRGRMQPVERRRVFAPGDGVIRALHAKHGDHVKAGQKLIELQNTDLEIEAAELQGRRTAAFEQSLAAERALFDGTEQVSAAQRAKLSGERERLREEIASLDRQLQLHAEKRKELTIVSPIEGEIMTWNADDLLSGRPVRKGQQLLTVAAVDGAWELELNLPDARSGRVVEAAASSAEPLTITYSPAVDSSVVREARVVEIQNAADVQGDAGNVVLVKASLNVNDLPQRRPGAEVAAHIHCGKRSTAYVWTRDIVDFVRSKVLFRWF